MNKKIFLVSVVLAAATAADVNQAAAMEAAQIYTANPAELLTALSLSGCKVLKSTIKNV